MLKLKYAKDNLFLNFAFEIKSAFHGRIIFVSFHVFLNILKMIPNELPDVDLRLKFIDQLFIPVKYYRQEQQQIKVNL